MMRNAFIICLVGLMGPASPSAPEGYSISFTVVNRWGAAHNYRVLHFWSAARRDLASRFQGLEASDMPHGTYEYELVPAPEDRAGENLSGSVAVYQNQTHVTRVIGATDSLGDSLQRPVSGAITPRPLGNSRLWVIVENVYGGYRKESSVDASGSFQFNYVWGNNVVVVCAGSEVLMAGPLVVGRNQILRGMRIDLAARRIEPDYLIR